MPIDVAPRCPEQLSQRNSPFEPARARVDEGEPRQVALHAATGGPSGWPSSEKKLPTAEATVFRPCGSTMNDHTLPSTPSLRAQLRSAHQVLSMHGLRIASKWVAEQLIGLPEPNSDSHPGGVGVGGGGGGGVGVGVGSGSGGSGGGGFGDVEAAPMEHPDSLKALQAAIANTSDRFLLAKNYFDLGEYAPPPFPPSLHPSLLTLAALSSPFARPRTAPHTSLTRDIPHFAHGDY